MSRFYMYSNVLFKAGALNKLADEVTTLGLKRPLLVTDPGLSALGLAKRCLDLCPDLTLFDGTPENPTEEAVYAALKKYKSSDCDGIVALGGGSSMDLGKAVALLASHEGKLIDFCLTQENPRSLDQVPPILVIPTTSGTGTEISIGCVISLPDGHKTIIDSEKFIPKAVICDPELTLSLPPRLTAATGIDALSHCIEGYCSNIENPLTESIALDGVRRIGRSLEIAVNEPDNLQARSDMMIGSLQGGLAMTMELGAAHALSVPLGAHFHGHHGELTGAVLGSVMEFNEFIQPEVMVQIRQALGISRDESIRHWMNNLCIRIGLRVKLSEMEVTEESLPVIATEASGSFFDSTNPRQGSVDEYLSILKAQF